jgi:Mg-chelatase subunit ChlD
LSRAVLYILVFFLALKPCVAGAQVETQPANIVFLLDVSNSMGRDKKMELLRKSTEELCKLLNKKDRISLLTFGSTVELLYSTSSYSGPDSLLKILSRVRSNASATNINRGIYDAYELAEKLKVQSGNHVLLVTDGEFALNPYTKNMVLSKNDIFLTCVVIGKGVSGEKAVKYITEELKLKVITLVNEEEDAKKLAALVRAELVDNQ